MFRQVLTRSPSDAVMLSAVRSPITCGHFLIYSTTRLGNTNDIGLEYLMTRAQHFRLVVPWQKPTVGALSSFRGHLVSGCAPDEMGIGPIDALKNLYRVSGVSRSDVDVFGLNEAFASQSIHCIRTLGMDFAKVNPNTGAIALGHPIGSTWVTDSVAPGGQGKRAPFPLPKDDEIIDFVDGLHTLRRSGDPNLRESIALFVFMINMDMDHRVFCNTDGNFLIVAQLGNLI